MSKGTPLSIFDRVAVGTIIVAGCLQALQQMLKDQDRVTSAVPMLKLDGWWNYVPLALIVIGCLSWCLKQVFHTAPRIEPPVSPVKPSAATEFVAIPTPASALAPRPGPDQPVAVTEERVFVGPEITPESLIAEFENRTNLEGNRLVRPYVGKWMKVRGIFQDATHSLDLCSLVLAAPPFSRQLSTLFHADWLDQIELLKRGQEVAFVGKIANVDKYSCLLRECELIPLSEASDAIWVGVEPPKPKRTRKPKAI